MNTKAVGLCPIRKTVWPRPIRKISRNECRPPARVVMWMPSLARALAVRSDDEAREALTAAVTAYPLNWCRLLDAP